MMDVAHHGRLIPDLPGTVPRTGAVGGAAIPGNPDQPYIDVTPVLDKRQPHEGGYPCETRHYIAGNRPEGA